MLVLTASCAQFFAPEARGSPGTRIEPYDYERHATIVPEEALSLDYIEYYEEETVAEIKKLVPDYLSLTRAAERNLHYLTA